MHTRIRIKDYIIYPGIIVVLIWTGALAFLQLQRQNSLNLARTNLSTVAHDLAEQISILSNNIDRILLFLRQLDKDNKTSEILVALTLSSKPQDNPILQIALMDEHGIVTESSLGRPKEPIDLRDRAHFRAHKDSAEDFLYISDPVVGRVSHRPSIQFSRRIMDRAGGFGGVIVGSVSPERLSNYYSSGFFEGHATITLFNERGVVLARSRNAPGEKAVSDISAAPNYIAFREKGNSCTVSNSYFDDTEKLICFHRVSDFPLGIAISLPLHTVVSSDGSERITILAVAGIVSLLAFGAMFISRKREMLLEVASSELVHTKELAQAKASELEITLQSIDQGILIYDKNGQLIYENPIAIRLGQYGPELSASINLCLTGFKQNTDKFLKTQLLDNRSVEVLTIETSKHPSTLEIKAFHAATGYLILSLTDITTIKDAESALKVSVEKERNNAQGMRTFLGVMSHEFRTPLHSILGFTSLLKQKVSTPEQEELVGFTLNAAHHLKSLLGDISDFIYFDAGAVTLKNDIFNFADFRAKIDRISHTLSLNNCLNLETTFDDSLPLTVFGDERRLVQLMTNFLSNAIKYTVTGTVHTSYRLLSRSGYNAVVEFKVTDTGLGISNQDVSRVFDPFFRSQLGAVSSDGTGLGLTISKQIVALMKGQIHLKSVVGEGTTIIAEIPLKTMPGKEEPSSQEAPNDLPRLNILVAEDNASNRILIEKMLASLGQDVVAVKDGMAAVEEARRKTFDGVILDIQMPRLDGYGAASEISRIYGALERHVQIAALTAQVVDFDWVVAKSSGIERLLEKPLQERDLVDFITSTHSVRSGS
jgi:signal transduction histidine kinase